MADRGALVTGLPEHLDSYLRIRRAVGFKLARTELLLNDFLRYLDERHHEVVTIDAAISWAGLPPNGQSNWRANRLSVVRGFARHLHVIDPAHQVPPTKIFPTPKARADPFFYSSGDITALMNAANLLASPLRATVMETIVGLLSVTGLRIGEALRLDLEDINPLDGILAVNDSKFGKSRRVPLHPSTVDALNAYLHIRAQATDRGEAAVFISSTGRRLRYDTFHHSWLQLVARAGLGVRSRSRPRPHDLRHTFAVNTLVGWQRNGEDVAARLPALSTFLGHIDPAATYWYLTATPELLACATERLNRKPTR